MHSFYEKPEKFGVSCPHRTKSHVQSKYHHKEPSISVNNRLQASIHLAVKQRQGGDMNL